MKLLRIFLLIAAISGISFAETPKEKNPAGMWNDGLEGENTGLYFAADGSGDYISLACHPLKWSYDPDLHIVTIHLQVSGRKEQIMRFLFDAESQSSNQLDSKNDGRDWNFKRADQKYTNWWLAVKKENGG